LSSYNHGLKHYWACHLAEVAQGHQTFVDLEIIEPFTAKDFELLRPSVDEIELLGFSIRLRYLHLWVNIIQIPFE
jgi:hypothetical protein